MTTRANQQYLGQAAVTNNLTVDVTDKRPPGGEPEPAGAGRRAGTAAEGQTPRPLPGCLVTDSAAAWPGQVRQYTLRPGTERRCHRQVWHGRGAFMPMAGLPTAEWTVL